ERPQQVHADSAQRAEIRDGRAPSPGHESRDKPSAGRGMQGMAARKCPRSEHQIRASGKDRIQHQRDLLRPLTADRVGEDSDARIGRQGADAGEARRSVAAPRLTHHARTGFARNGSRRVGGAVVDHDDLGDGVTRSSAHNVADDGGLVQRGHDQDYLHPAPARARKLASEAEAPRSLTTPAIASGATSTSRAHTGIAHGPDKKKLYAKPTVPVKTIHVTEGVTARKGTSQTTYHGKTFDPSTMTPAIIGIARSARLPPRPRHALTNTQPAVAASASSGS